MTIVRKKATRSVTWWVGLAIFALAVFAFFTARDYGRAGVMPTWTAIALILLTGLHTVSGLIVGVFANNDDWYEEEGRREMIYRRRLYVSLAAGVGLFIWLLGFHITLPVFLLLFIGITTRKWLVASMMGFGIWVFTYVLLSQTMHIVFPITVLQRVLISQGIY